MGDNELAADQAAQDTQDIQALKEERDSLFDRLLRKQAEFENYKKRMDREKAEFVQFASAEVMKELLGTVDSFELALRNAASGGSGKEEVLRGLELIQKQLLDTLGRFLD